MKKFNEFLGDKEVSNYNDKYVVKPPLNNKGEWCVYNKYGKLVKCFSDKFGADKYAKAMNEKSEEGL